MSTTTEAKKQFVAWCWWLDCMGNKVQATEFFDNTHDAIWWLGGKAEMLWPTRIMNWDCDFGVLVRVKLRGDDGAEAKWHNFGKIEKQKT